MYALSRRQRRVGGLGIALLFLASGVGTCQQAPQKQEIPDAPSTTQPPKPPANPLPSPQEAPPPSQPAPQTGTSAAPQPAGETPAPPFKITTVPEGGATQEPGTQEELFKLKSIVNQVLVPVMVKDDSGRLVSGLLPKDFSVLEDGVKQKLNFFTSDPFPLSAAVILDTGMPDVALQKVNKTFPSLEGAFTQFDEVAVYTYSGTFSKVKDYSELGQTLYATLNSLKTVSGSNNGPPVTSGPLGPHGPVVNGVPVESPVPPVVTPPREAHVLNDVILAAALDLGKRDRARRKIIFIISDGREYGSDASYSDVLRVLLSNGILVYGIGVEGAAIPLYSKLQRAVHIPKFGYADILPKYANATGGEVYNELGQAAIDKTYAKVIGDARNQYTLGYVGRATPSTAYRQIEVRVGRPGCKSSDLRPCVNVIAKDGYYPLPPGR
ncbi:MAG: VWA domain-containing protein [Acidobacteriia bacterium]|nr:VWA domain-containing protein [Terriglobia bacterium]